VPLGTSQEISQPGTSSTPTSAARLADASNPSIRSWSVSATALQPLAAASSGMRSGGSDPSDAVEWVWRSITGRREYWCLGSPPRRSANVRAVTMAAVPDAPVISVVIPTHNRTDRLRDLIRALRDQTVQEPFEVLVVDDASTDDTWDELGRLAAEHRFLRPLRLDVNRGPATARNLGWRSAHGTYVAFTDDDCLPEPGWLTGLLTGLRVADVVQGCTVPNPDHVHRSGPFSHTVKMTYELGFYETCNMAYRRDVLERVGGFDERIRFAWGEDTDLAWRAKNSGASSTFVDDAVVRHEISDSDWRRYMRLLPRREGIVLAFREYPQLRWEHLNEGRFFQPQHKAALGATAAGILAATKPTSPARLALALAAGGWYARACRHSHMKPSRKLYWFGVVPMAFIADMYELFLLARASVRFRTAVLVRRPTTRTTHAPRSCSERPSTSATAPAPAP
jgi:GT2 family glycosyltransferase